MYDVWCDKATILCTAKTYFGCFKLTPFYMSHEMKVSHEMSQLNAKDKLENNTESTVGRRTETNQTL